jgi:protein translocase SecG subunit
MNALAPLLPYIQIVLSLLLIGGVLLQQRGAGLGGAFGGGMEETSFSKRRGAELFLFRATIVVAVLLTLSAVVALIA